MPTLFLGRLLAGLACLTFGGLSNEAGQADVHTVREESFTTLFPIDAQALAQATTPEEAVAVVARTAPHLGDVLGAPALERLLSLATEGTPLGTTAADGNPLADADTAKRTREVSHARWFLVGMRLAPCANPTFLPTAWLRVSETSERRVCVPQVRLVAQAFGVRREEDPQTGAFRPMGSSDDKTLHLVFDALPGFDTTSVARLRAGERSLEQAVGTLEPGFGHQELMTSFETVDTQDLQGALEAARGHLVNAALSLPALTNGNGTIEDLVREAKENPHALAFRQSALRKALRETLLSGARLRHVTLNFSNSGAAARPGASWLFARLAPRAPDEGEAQPSENAFPMANVLKAENLARFDAQVTFEKTPLLAPAWETLQGSSPSHAFKVVSAGKHETFLPVPGRPTSVDAELLAAARSDAFTARALSLGGLFPFFVGDTATSNDALESDLTRGLEGPAAKTLAIVASGLFSPGVHGPASGPCASCHAATGARVRYLGQKWPVASPASLDLRDDSSLLNFGHASFNEMWNLRMLGFFERSPSVADRVILETREEASFARAWLSASHIQNENENENTPHRRPTP
jgi:hypothetical protein